MKFAFGGSRSAVAGELRRFLARSKSDETVVGELRR